MFVGKTKRPVPDKTGGYVLIDIKICGNYGQAPLQSLMLSIILNHV
jgi:hypothetical protein